MSENGNGNADGSEGIDADAQELIINGPDKLMNPNAVMLMIENMLNFANNSPDTYFDVGPIEAMRDGSLEFDFVGSRFRIEVTQVES